MGVLTLIFIVLKLIGTIDWSWWLIVLPSIIDGIFIIICIVIQVSIRKKIKEEVREGTRRFYK